MEKNDNCRWRDKQFAMYNMDKMTKGPGMTSPIEGKPRWTRIMASTTDVVAVTLTAQMLEEDKWDEFIRNVVHLSTLRRTSSKDYPYYPEYVGIHVNTIDWAVTVYMKGVG